MWFSRPFLVMPTSTRHSAVYSEWDGSAESRGKGAKQLNEGKVLDEPLGEGKGVLDTGAGVARLDDSYALEEVR